MCYATAAMLLQRKYADQLREGGFLQGVLPGWFAADLDVPTDTDPQTALQVLSQRQRVLSGEKLNWLATYEQAGQRFIARLAWEIR